MRRKPDVKNRRKTDGIIFNTGGGNFGFLERKDSYYQIILDTEGGYTEPRVTKGQLHTFYNYINDEKMTKPMVVFDKNENESAIVYAPYGTQIKQHFTDMDNVYLELEMR